jgi:hypothetical protein
MPDWASLPDEIICRIVFHYKRARAASRIQAVWRGRDTRDFLEHPASQVFNSRHPRFGANCHFRRCQGCFLQTLYYYNLRREVFTTMPNTGSWSVRCLYLMAYDPQRVAYV